MNRLKRSKKKRKDNRMSWGVSFFHVIILFSIIVTSCNWSNGKGSLKDYGKASLKDSGGSCFSNFQTSGSENPSLFFSENLKLPEFSPLRSFIPEYAVLSCGKAKLEGNFLTDSFVSLKGECGGENIGALGSVAVANSAKLEGNAKILGDLILGEKADFKIEGNAKIQGQIIIRKGIICPDILGLIGVAKQKNDNQNLPVQLKEGELEVEDGETVILESGVYYFKKLKVEGKLDFRGLAFVFVEEELKVGGKGVIGAFPTEVRFVVGNEAKVEGKVYGTIISRKVEGKGQIFGAVVSMEEYKGEGQVHFDETLSNLYYTFGGQKLNLLLSSRHIILAPADTTLSNELLGDLSPFIINLRPFFDSTFIAEVVNPIVYSIFEQGLTGVKFAGNPIIFQEGITGLITRREFILALSPNSNEEEILLRHNLLKIRDVFGDIKVVESIKARTSYSLLKSYHETITEIPSNLLSVDINFFVFPEKEQQEVAMPNDPDFATQQRINAEGRMYIQALK